MCRDREVFATDWLDRGASQLPAFVNISQSPTEDQLDWAMRSSGESDQDRFAPGAPFWSPLIRLGAARPLAGDRAGSSARPGPPSLLSGIEEFPLLRDNRCSSFATLSASSLVRSICLRLSSKLR